MEEALSTSVTFVPPSVKDHRSSLLSGNSYTHYSEVPASVTRNDALSSGTACVLGVDEAGRGPVIGPMVYGVYYLPRGQEKPLLTEQHHFDDSKVLTPTVRANLMQTICTNDTDLFKASGWAISSLSAQDIGSGMLKNGGSYNLNAQAMDATIDLIRGVLERGVNVQEIFVDTIGAPIVYQRKLERIFPNIRIIVEKKADSLYPCVSAASVVAKVTRDVSCETLMEEYLKVPGLEESLKSGWGSGYPSDSKCASWLKAAIDPVFGWGNECRFSWGTAKDMLELKGGSTIHTDWPADADEENTRLSQYFNASGNSASRTENDELRLWFGNSLGQTTF